MTHCAATCETCKFERARPKSRSPRRLALTPLGQAVAAVPPALIAAGYSVIALLPVVDLPVPVVVEDNQQ